MLTSRLTLRQLVQLILHANLSQTEPSTIRGRLSERRKPSGLLLLQLLPLRECLVRVLLPVRSLVPAALTLERQRVVCNLVFVRADLLQQGFVHVRSKPRLRTQPQPVPQTPASS